MLIYNKRKNQEGSGHAFALHFLSSSALSSPAEDAVSLGGAERGGSDQFL